MDQDPYREVNRSSAFQKKPHLLLIEMLISMLTIAAKVCIMNKVNSTHTLNIDFEEPGTDTCVNVMRYNVNNTCVTYR